MKFTAEKNVLAQALATAARGTGGRNNPILSGVLLQVSDGVLSVTGTDLDLTIRTRVELVDAINGAVVVPAKLLSEIVKSLPPGAVQMDVDADDNAIVSGARAKFSLRTYPAVEFPKCEAAEGVNATLDAKDFVAAAKQTIYAASTDDARPLLTGVLFDCSEATLRMVATDSYRLVIRDLPDAKSIEGAENPLIPATALAEVVNAIGKKPDGVVDMVFGTNMASFGYGETQITTRLLEGTYPAYRQLLPESYSYEATVSKSDILNALKRTALLVRDNTTPVRMDCGTERIEFFVRSHEVGEADEYIDVNELVRGDSVLVAFNPKYLAEAIDACTTADVVLRVDSSTKPAAIQEYGCSDYLSLLMPVRVS